PDEHWLPLGFRAERYHLFDEARFGGAHVLDRLAGHGLRQEPDEIAGMAGPEGDADLAVVLHAADAWPVSGTRIEHDEGPLMRINSGSGRRNDPHQGIVPRPLEFAPIQDQLGREGQHMWRRLLGALHVVVAALTKHIEYQDGAFAGIAPVLL